MQPQFPNQGGNSGYDASNMSWDANPNLPTNASNNTYNMGGNAHQRHSSANMGMGGMAANGMTAMNMGMGMGQQNNQPQASPMTAMMGHMMSGGNGNGGGVAAPFTGMIQDPTKRAVANFVGDQLTNASHTFFPRAKEWFSLDPLKYYFHVNNSYVLNKLKIILFPFVHKQWQREVVDTGAMSSVDSSMAMSGAPSGAALSLQPASYKPPCNDINAPDLYIPTMAAITYILLYGYCRGTSGGFTPELLGGTASAALAWLAIELAIMRGGFALLCANMPAPSMLDLTAYATYKYVGLIADMLIGLLLGSAAFYCAILTFGLFSCVFIMRTMKRSVIPAIDSVGKEAEGRRRSFLLGLGLLQVIISFFLVKGAIVAATAATNYTSVPHSHGTAGDA